MAYERLLQWHSLNAVLFPLNEELVTFFDDRNAHSLWIIEYFIFKPHQS
jgi:hypothetical protein